MKSRAEGAARDSGGEYIKNDLDTKALSPLHVQYTPRMRRKRVISVTEMQHFYGILCRICAETQRKWIFIKIYEFF